MFKATEWYFEDDDGGYATIRCAGGSYFKCQAGWGASTMMLETKRGRDHALSACQMFIAFCKENSSDGEVETEGSEGGE